MTGKITDAHARWTQHVIETQPGSKTAGFWREHGELCQHLGLDAVEFPFRPDAFRFNAETTEIEIYEVEVQSFLRREKIAILGAFWAWWDGEEHDWEPVLFLIDRFGNISRMDLMHAENSTGWAA